MNSVDLIKKYTRLTKNQELILKKLGLETALDLLFYFPNRYIDTTVNQSIAEIKESQNVIISGEVFNIKKEVSWKSKIPMTKAKLKDTTEIMDIVWLHQPYISKILKEGEIITISGVAVFKNGKKTITNPDILNTKNQTNGDLFSENKKINLRYIPVYPETKGLSSKWFYYAIGKILATDLIKNIKDPLPQEILDKYHLPKLSSALLWIHSPKNNGDSEAARKRFAFEEIITIEIERLIARAQYQSFGAYNVNPDIKDFVNSLPYKLTNGQNEVLKDVVADCNSKLPMTRLLQGDVGSGKTAIAAAISYATINTPSIDKKNEYLQVLYMAPTEILANQHFESFIKMFEPFNKTIGLLTSSGCKKFPAKSISMKRSDINWTPVSRTQILKWAKDGTIDILIGTHSLMNKKVEMRHSALAIIDEQHRFGSKQRKALISKDGLAPHLLSMSATPIPRTLALTIFGDLDLSLLTDMPPGRKDVITKFITKEQRSSMYEHIRKELDIGRQAYVICPRINAKDTTVNAGGGVRSVTEEVELLKTKEFKNYRIGALHGKLKPTEKEDIMEQFLRHEIDILVATSVVEVGVNIPNASVVIIEEAERFGIAQLHQLRGRVIRGNHQPYCYLTSNSTNEKSGKRLTTLVETKNGFELAEADLMERGPGHFAGIKQSGVSDLAMEALRNIKLVEAAKKEAKIILEKDPNLIKHPEIKLKLQKNKEVLHFE